MKNIFCCLGLTILILDNQTARTGIQEGIDLCLHAVIPSLFPFLIISSLLSSLNNNSKSRILNPIGALCGIPAGSESILLLGLLSGYPIGAQMISQAYAKGALKKDDALRMLGFCSNAGPAFIFGICSSIFQTKTVFILWIIHIASVLITARVLPGKHRGNAELRNVSTTSLSDAIKKATISMAIICAWISFFRILLVYIQKWFLNLVKPSLFCFISGFLELTNGIIMLNGDYLEGQKFIYVSSFLAFGGLCVLAQTLSVTRSLGMGYYFPGKLIQSSTSFIIAYCVQFFIYAPHDTWQINSIYLLIPLSIVIVTYIFLRYKKTVAFSGIMMYNKAKFST